MNLLSVATTALGVLLLSSGMAMAQLTAGPGPTTTPETPAPDGVCYFNCEPGISHPTPGPEDEEPGPGPGPKGDADPQGKAKGKQALKFALACELRDNGLVFRNVGDLAVAARSRLAWSTSDGQRGTVVIGAAMEPKSSWLYADVSAPARNKCAVELI